MIKVKWKLYNKFINYLKELHFSEERNHDLKVFMVVWDIFVLWQILVTPLLIISTVLV